MKNISRLRFVFFFFCVSWRYLKMFFFLFQLLEFIQCIQRVLDVNIKFHNFSLSFLHFRVVHFWIHSIMQSIMRCFKCTITTSVFFSSIHLSHQRNLDRKKKRSHSSLVTWLWVETVAAIAQDTVTMPKCCPIDVMSEVSLCVEWKMKQNVGVISKCIFSNSYEKKTHWFIAFDWEILLFR